MSSPPAGQAEPGSASQLQRARWGIAPRAPATRATCSTEPHLQLAHPRNRAPALTTQAPVQVATSTRALARAGRGDRPGLTSRTRVEAASASYCSRTGAAFELENKALASPGAATAPIRPVARRAIPSCTVEAAATSSSPIPCSTKFTGVATASPEFAPSGRSFRRSSDSHQIGRAHV